MSKPIRALPVVKWVLHKETAFGCGFVCTRVCFVSALLCMRLLRACQGLCTLTSWHSRDLDVCEDIWDKRLEIVSLRCLRIQYQNRCTHSIPPVDEEATNQRDVTVSPIGLEPIPGPPCPQMVGCCCWLGGAEVVFREANQGVLWEGGCLLKKHVFKIKQFSLASLPHGRRPPPPPCWIISRQTH